MLLNRFLPFSAPPTKHLLDTGFAVLVRLLQVILFLIQIRQLGLQTLGLILDPLLHIRDGRAHEPAVH